MKTGIKVHIPAHIYEEIDYYVQQTDDEISGLGRIVKDEDGTLRVIKIYLPKQENSGASTDLDQDSVAELMFTSREDEGDLTFWWHSHNSMAAFWSGTDHATIEDLGKNGYVVATVFNHKREYKTAYYQGGNGFHPEIFIDNVDTSFHAMPLKTDIKKWDKNVEQAVVKKVVLPTYNVKRNWKKDKKKKGQTSILDTDGVWEAGKEWCSIRQGWYDSEDMLAEQTETLSNLIGYFDATQWEELYCEDRQIAWHDIDDAKLIEYWQEHDGDYNKALTSLMVKGA